MLRQNRPSVSLLNSDQNPASARGPSSRNNNLKFLILGCVVAIHNDVRVEPKQ